MCTLAENRTGDTKFSYQSKSSGRVWQDSLRGQNELSSPSNAVQVQNIRQGGWPRVLRESLARQGLHRMERPARTSVQDCRCETPRIVCRSIHCGAPPSHCDIRQSPSASLVRRLSSDGAADSCTLAVAAVLAWLWEIRRAYCRAC